MVVKNRRDDGCKVYLHIPNNNKETVALMPPTVKPPPDDLLMKNLSTIIGENEAVWIDVRN